MTEQAWAKALLLDAWQQAQAQAMPAQVALRALLAQVVELNRQHREAMDLAQELEFLAANLDPARDYAFMRP